MAIIEKSIKSKVNDLDIGITIVTPAKNKKVKSIIQIVSGISEDRKNYMPFLNFLARKGYISVINDYPSENLNINKIIANVHEVTELVKKEYPNKQVTIIGNDIGSLIAKNYIQKYDYEVDKLIISGSISKRNDLIGLVIVKLLSLIKGSSYKNGKLNNFFLPKYLNNPEKLF